MIAVEGVAIGTARGEAGHQSIHVLAVKSSLELLDDAHNVLLFSRCFHRVSLDTAVNERRVLGWLGPLATIGRDKDFRLCRHFRLGLFPIAAEWYPMVLTQFYSFDQPNHPHLYDSTRHACNYPLIATPSKTECENANPSGCRYALAFSLVVASIRA